MLQLVRARCVRSLATRGLYQRICMSPRCLSHLFIHCLNYSICRCLAGCQVAGTGRLLLVHHSHGVRRVTRSINCASSDRFVIVFGGLANVAPTRFHERWGRRPRLLSFPCSTEGSGVLSFIIDVASVYPMPSSCSHIPCAP